MGARRASTSAVVAVVGAVLLITLLVAWAAAIGPGEILRGDGPEPDRGVPNTLVPAPTAPALPPVQDAVGERDTSLLLQILAMTLVVLVVLLVLYGLYQGVRLTRGAWRERNRPEPPPEHVDFDVLDAALLTKVVSEGAAAQRDLLATGTPRNAIVEVWNRFETLAGDAGVRRRPWETPSEFTLRMLEAMDVDSAATERLSALYREARFSDHMLTEEHRAAAVAALDAIHAGLPARGGTVRS